MDDHGDGRVPDRSPVDTASLLIGAVAHAVQRAGPETTEHLIRAGHELLLAVRAVVRHFAEAVTEAAGSGDAGGIEHIPIVGAPAAARPAEPSTEVAAKDAAAKDAPAKRARTEPAREP